MTLMRINLHIRADIHADLYSALAALSPHPRAELLRGLAMLGLKIENGHSPMHRDIAENLITVNRKHDSSTNETSRDDEFSADLQTLIFGLNTGKTQD